MATSLTDHWAYYLSLLRNKLGNRLLNTRRRLKTAYKNNVVVTRTPQGPVKGSVLLSYVLDPFLLTPGEPIPHWHSNYTESVLMAQTFLDMGYEVDVIEYTNNLFIPHKNYAVFVDSRWNMKRLSNSVGPDCLRIMHIDVAHLLFSNYAESRRLLELQQRREVTLLPRRLQERSMEIEYADGATVLGNKFTMDTFRYAHKPLYPVPIIPPIQFPWVADKDLEACRRRYVWFGSGGLVRKGLDLALEAFARMPEYHLTVCGPIDQEKDFEDAYRKELYETENIRTVGWVDVKGPVFEGIINLSLGLVFPSCCEGQAGGVVTCLQAGLIPIISYETGVDTDGFGVILRTSSIDEIMESVKRISALPISELETMRRTAWEYARRNHSPERFSEKYREAVESLMAFRSAGVTAK